MIEAKASLGFSPSTAIEDITEEKMQMKFGQKLIEVSFDVVMVSPVCYCAVSTVRLVSAIIFLIYSQN